jgi:hypothetical protein
LATKVRIVKKFLKMGDSTPLRYALTSGMPEPAAAGLMRKSDTLEAKASARLKLRAWPGPEEAGRAAGGFRGNGWRAGHRASQMGVSVHPHWGRLSRGMQMLQAPAVCAVACQARQGAHPAYWKNFGTQFAFSDCMCAGGGSERSEGVQCSSSATMFKAACSQATSTLAPGMHGAVVAGMQLDVVAVAYSICRMRGRAWPLSPLPAFAPARFRRCHHRRVPQRPPTTMS